MPRIVVIFFVLFFFSTNLYSVSFRRIGIKDGLSSRQVFRIEKDSSGFVWFFTYLGIDRYDGNEFRHYKLDKTPESRDYILSSTIMNCDPLGNIWISLKNGKLYNYDPFTDTFKLEIDLNTVFTETVSLNDICFNEGKGVWLCLSIGLYYYELESKALTPAGMEGEFINRIIRLADGSFVVGTNTHLFRLLKNENEHTLTVSHGLNFPVESRAESLYAVKDKLFVGTFSDGVFMLDMSDGDVVSFKSIIPYVPIRSIASTSRNTVLVGTDGAGIYELDLNGGLLNRYFADEDNEKSLSGNTVSDIMVDENDCIWISTYTNGVSYLDSKVPEIRWVKHGYKNDNSLLDSHINVIMQDSEGDLWYGTNGGVSLYQPDINKWSHFLNHTKGDPGHSFVVLALCEDSDNNIWVGGYGIGVYCINKRTGKEQKIESCLLDNTKKGIATDYVYAIYCDEDRLYFGGIEGDFTLYNTNTKSYTYYPIDCIGDLASGDENQLLIAGCNGLAFFNKETGEAVWYNQFDSINLQYPVRSLIQSSQGDIWLGTDGNGLICYNPKTQKSQSFSISDGLDSNTINSVLEDDSGGIWFNTEKNLYYLNPRNSKIMEMNDYLQISWGYFNPNAFIKLNNGNLALGTAEGAIIFSPDFDFEVKESIDLIFTDFKLLYQSVQAGVSGSLLKQSIDKTASIKLDYAQNSFSIAFSAIDFSYPHRTDYEYKLENFNEEWLAADATRSVDYMNLPSGKYIFRLRALDKYTRNEQGTRSLTIVVGRPFWASIWAVLIYFVLFCTILYLSFQYARHRIKEYKSKEKIRSFITIAHDIRTPITLIKAPLSDLETQTHLPDDVRKSLSVARKNAEKLFEMVTQLLDLQKTDLHPEKDSVSLNSVYSYMEEKLANFKPLAIQKAISLNLDIEPDFPMLWFDKGKLNKIMDNLLSNAVKYTEDGSVSIVVKRQKSKWIIEVHDTGIGIPSKDQKYLFTQFFRAENAVRTKETGTGIGLFFVSKLVRQLGAQISFTSSENVGTSFVVTLPLNAYAPETDEHKDDAIQPENTQELPVQKNVLLLAEDDPDMRDYLTENLSKEYEVVSLPDGEKVVELAREINPDIIISDVIMPVSEGTEICRILKSSIETSHIPIILLTALSEREYVIAGLEAGANDYIIKPFDFTVLKARIKNILQSRQHLREVVLSSGGAIEDTDYSGQLDKEFLNRAIEIINEELSNSEFTINNFCRELGMSRTSVYNKLKSLTDQSPNDFIRIIRLNKSRELLATHRYTIGEVSCMVGFSDSKYFSTCFKKQFGISPSKI